MTDYEAGIQKVVVVDVTGQPLDYEAGVQQVELNSGRMDSLEMSLAQKASKTDLDPLASKDYVNSQILTVNTGGTIDLSYKADVSYVDGYNNHTLSYTYYDDGSVHTVTEKDSSNNVIETVTYTYNSVGDVSTSVTVKNGSTLTTTYNYDVNGNITSTVNTLS